MTIAALDDVSLYYEDLGSGPPIFWCHEYFGDSRSWAPQLSAFSRHYRNIVYSARGYPGSSSPDQPAAYSQDLMVDDLRRLMDHLNIPRAFVAGLSMGANVALNFGLRHPGRCVGLVIAGCGSGSTDRVEFEQGAAEMLACIEQDGMSGLATLIATNPTRRPLFEKDPAGFAELCARLIEHDARAAQHVYRGVQLKRPSVLSLGEKMAATSVPALVMFGDLDRPCIDPGLFMWKSLPVVRLAVLPATGHCVNLEEPALFNTLVASFFSDIGRS